MDNADFFFLQNFVTPTSSKICNFCSFGGHKFAFCVSEDNVWIFMNGKYYYWV